jgi:hypothetical protein
MSDRGNKRPSLAVKVIVALIVVLGVLWLGIQAMQKEPHSPRQGSQALPGAAAERQLAPGQPKQ